MCIFQVFKVQTNWKSPRFHLARQFMVWFMYPNNCKSFQTHVCITNRHLYNRWYICIYIHIIYNLHLYIQSVSWSQFALGQIKPPSWHSKVGPLRWSLAPCWLPCESPRLAPVVGQQMSCMSTKKLFVLISAIQCWLGSYMRPMFFGVGIKLDGKCV